VARAFGDEKDAKKQPNRDRRRKRLDRPTPNY
jgi:hypothetical protein